MNEIELDRIAQKSRNQRKDFEWQQQRLYVKALKALNREYSEQNSQLVEIIKHYSKLENGELAKAALEAWEKRVSEPNPLTKYKIERHQYLDSLDSLGKKPEMISVQF